MKRLNIKTIVIIMGIFFCLGCAAPGRYLKNRATDFADCFKADVGVGFGVDVQVKATEYIATGVGGSISSNVIFQKRGINKENIIHIGLPFSPILSLLNKHQPYPIYITDFAVGGGYDSDLYGHYASILFINTYAFRQSPNINTFDVGFGGTALLVRAYAGFSFGQFLDFVMGIAGIDIANDDEKTEIVEHKERREPNK